MTVLDMTAAREALSELRKYDHNIITAEGVNAIRTGFGLAPLVEEQLGHFEHGQGEGKYQVTLHDGIKEMRGQSDYILALNICDELKVPYDSKFGRGSQLRACTSALGEWLTKQEEGE